MYLAIFLKRIWMEKVSLRNECEKVHIKSDSPSQPDTFQMQAAGKREEGTLYKAHA